MPNLSCNVTSCTNNKNNYCCISNIEVGGAGAVKPCDTCCESYAPQMGVQNATVHENRVVDIMCKATHCVYNEKQRCDAPQVDIKGPSACTCGETECQTFVCDINRE